MDLDIWIAEVTTPAARMMQTFRDFPPGCNNVTLAESDLVGELTAAGIPADA